MNECSETTQLSCRYIDVQLIFTWITHWKYSWQQVFARRQCREEVWMGGLAQMRTTD